MDHFYKGVPGYCTFAEDWYPELVRRLNMYGPHVVEVGCYAGQSAACLGVELLRVKAPALGVRLDLVDWFNQVDIEEVRKNLAPIAHIIGAMHKCLSWEGAAHYEDASLDAVFIDASHEGPDVARDIDAWLPKVKPGGIISGHDFCLEFPGVIHAVTERFPVFEVWRGSRFCTDPQMQGKLYPCWVATVAR